MESTNTKITRKEIIQIVFNILLALAIAALLFTVITLIRNAEEIRSNPVAYAIEHTELESCSCFDGNGVYYGFPMISNFGTNVLGEIGDLELAKEK